MTALDSYEPVLEVRGIMKSFDGHLVLQGIDLCFEAGKVHVLMGENGAGKSTLMKIVCGLEKPDSGEIRFKGRPRSFSGPQAALAAGIVMIHQELLPFPNLTVAENIFIGQESDAGFPGMFSWRELFARTERLLSDLNLALPPDTLARNLKVAELQMIEIAKAVSRRADVVIMDEPTSSLSEAEVRVLFNLIATLRNRGVAIIYISHRMEEIFQIGDRISVLRDGCHVSTDEAAALDAATLVSRIAGRSLGSLQRRIAVGGQREALSVARLTRRRKYQNVSFTLNYGEVLGIAGLMGAGRTEIAHAIYGLEPADSGEIRVNTQPVQIRRPADALRVGIALVNEDRKQQGLVLGMSVEHNLTLANLRACCRSGAILESVEHEMSDTQIRSFGIKTRSREQLVKYLSGGNQQKVLIAKAIFSDPKVLILDEPTRGVDVGAKAEIYELIARFVNQGRAVLLISSELPELMALSDRLLVIREGEIVAELDPALTSQPEVIRHAMPA